VTPVTGVGRGAGYDRRLIHQPLVMALAGGVFVAEDGSVLIQRGWFKYTRKKYGQGRRVFLMAPGASSFSETRLA